MVAFGQLDDPRTSPGRSRCESPSLLQQVQIVIAKLPEARSVIAQGLVN